MSICVLLVANVIVDTSFGLTPAKSVNRMGRGARPQGNRVRGALDEDRGASDWRRNGHEAEPSAAENPDDDERRPKTTVPLAMWEV